MTTFSMEIPKDFDWKSENGQVMNLLLNMSGGLKEEHLSEDEKALLKKHGYKFEGDEDEPNTKPDG